MSDAGCELAERGHLLGLDKARLGSLEVAKGCFSGVAGGTDLSLGALALGDVAVNEDKAAIGHRVVTNFEDAVVWTCALERVVPPRILSVAAQLSLGVGARAELATLGQIADIVGVDAWLAKKRVGQIKNLLR